MANYDWSYSRDKNFVIFTEKVTGRIYEFNIDTGILVNTTTHRTLATFPAGLGKYLSEYRSHRDGVVSLMGIVRERPYRYNINRIYGENVLTKIKGYEQVIEAFQIIDKIQHLGVPCDGYNADFSIDALKFIKDNFKEFTKYCNSEEHPSFFNFETVYMKQAFRNKYQYLFTKYGLSNEIIELISSQYKFFMNDTEPLALYCYFLSRGVYEFCGREAINKIREYFNYCEKTRIKPEKGDFFKLYLIVKRTYEMNKRIYDANALKANYNAHKTALTFEDDNFVVIFPTCAEDFQNEANYQSNCVYNNYFESAVNGTTHIVFIRRKNDINTPYITCEVYHSRIIQFLGRFNSHINDEDANNFKAAYQKHLNANW